MDEEDDWSRTAAQHPRRQQNRGGNDDGCWVAWLRRAWEVDEDYREGKMVPQVVAILGDRRTGKDDAEEDLEETRDAIGADWSEENDRWRVMNR